MEKSVLLIFAVFLAIYGRGQSSSRESLNGYQVADVQNMIAPFKTVNSQPPQITNVWFSKDIVNNMVALLQQERKQRHTQGLSLTDGIRIYIAYDNTGKETIVVVSTYDTGQKNPNANDNYHEDYYEHSSMAALFNMKDQNGNPLVITGSVCDNNCNNGASLYTPCTTANPCPPDQTCDSTYPHYLTQSQCNQMVQNYMGKTHNINTTAEWYDLDMITAFTKESAKIQNYDGIRIYFSTHPNDSKDADKNRDALVVVTTQSTTDLNIHTDYFNCSIGFSYYNRFPKYRTAHLEGEDKGELCPDNCTLP
jgi:hypothetical protein